MPSLLVILILLKITRTYAHYVRSNVIIRLWLWSCLVVDGDMNFLPTYLVHENIKRLSSEFVARNIFIELTMNFMKYEILWDFSNSYLSLFVLVGKLFQRAHYRQCYRLWITSYGRQTNGYFAGGIKTLLSHPFQQTLILAQKTFFLYLKLSWRVLITLQETLYPLNSFQSGYFFWLKKEKNQQKNTMRRIQISWYGSSEQYSKKSAKAIYKFKDIKEKINLAEILEKWLFGTLWSKFR